MLALVLGVKADHTPTKHALLAHLRERLYLDDANSRVLWCYDHAPPAQAEARAQLCADRLGHLCGQLRGDCGGNPVDAVSFGKWPCEMLLKSGKPSDRYGCSWQPEGAAGAAFREVWATYELGAAVARAANVVDIFGVMAAAVRAAGLWRGINRDAKPFPWSRMA